MTVPTTTIEMVLEYCAVRALEHEDEAAGFAKIGGLCRQMAVRRERRATCETSSESRRSPNSGRLPGAKGRYLRTDANPDANG